MSGPCIMSSPCTMKLSYTEQARHGLAMELAEAHLCPPGNEKCGSGESVEFPVEPAESSSAPSAGLM